MKIVVYEADLLVQEAFQGLTTRHDIVFIEAPLDTKNAKAAEDADIVSVFVYSHVKAEILSRFRQLQLIATRSTGYDHIDTEACQKHGIQIANVSSYGENTVAEHVFGLLLVISHHLYEAINRTRHGNFSLEGLQGFDLKGKTIGIIGTGDIGRHVIQIAKGFGLRVLAFDVKPDEDLADHLGFEYVSLDKLLSQADIITPHVPGNEKTYHLLSDEEFGRMKDGVVMINTARGSVVDEPALLSALTNGKVSAAGLDVLPEERITHQEAALVQAIRDDEGKHQTLLANEALLRLENVFVTPHSAFDTKEAVNRIMAKTVETIEAFVQGQSRNLIAAP